jgi:hypothetical protein
MMLKRKTMFSFVSMVLLAACSPDAPVPADDGRGQKEASVAERLGEELEAVGASGFVDRDYKVGVVRHIVLFRYRDAISKEDQREVTRRFLALQGSLRNGAPYIVSIEEGMQNGGEKLDGGFDQAFVVTFRSQGDRNYYVGQPIVRNPDFYDPAHHAFKEFVSEFLAPDGVLVFDYAVSQVAP